MFNFLRQSMMRQTNRLRNEFQEVIRPVVDRAVANAFERYRQRGAGLNNPMNSSNPNSHNSLNNFLARYQYIINTGLSTLTFFVSLAAAKFGYDAAQAQIEANRIQESLIRSIRDLTESNRNLTDAINQSNNNSNSQESSGNRIFRTIADLFQVGRTLFDLRRFFANRGGHTSGRRNSNDTEFTPPPSGRAHQDRTNHRKN